MKRATTLMAIGAACAGVISVAFADPPPRVKLVAKGTHHAIAKTVFGVAVDSDGNPVDDVFQEDRTPPHVLRFRNPSGRPGGWFDAFGYRAEVVSQRKLQKIADDMGDRYTKGDWITATYYQVGLDERQNIPSGEHNLDGVLVILPPIKGAAITAPRPLLQVTQSSFVVQDGVRYVVGSIRNNSAGGM